MKWAQRRGRTSGRRSSVYGTAEDCRPAVHLPAHGSRAIKLGGFGKRLQSWFKGSVPWCRPTWRGPLGARFKSIEQRLDALERERGAVTIHADNATATMPGAVELASAIRSIESTMRAPIVTEFDAKGRVKGARRAVEGAASASTIAALERE